ncbi:MAG: class I SAM-dependent methyltransferase [bacterium]
MIKDWYKHWFLSEEYLDVYGHRNEKDAEKFLNLVLKFIDIPGALVLDAACGAGRHSIALAKKGFNVTAFDLSRALLRIATRNSISENVSVKFFNADLRNVSLKKKFHLIINAFTSFGYFETDEENFSFIRNAFDYLLDDGKFILDYFNSDYLQRNLTAYSEKISEGKIIVERRSIVDDRVVKEIEIRNGSSNKIFYESVKLYSPDRLLKKLEEIGFGILCIYGNYNGEIFNQTNSERMILICGKK